MSWPSTETVVFGLLAAILMAGSVSRLALNRFGGGDVERAGSGRRLLVLMTVVGLVLLVAVAIYFWFCDPASESLRQWLGMRAGQSV